MIRKFVVSMLLTASLPALASSNLYTGGTGQYHTLPVGDDVQEITLMSLKQGDCYPQQGSTFYAINEFGQQESVPFEVPANSVFLIKDATFYGQVGVLAPVGMTPWLNIAAFGAGGRTKASFIASHSITGASGETFVGEGSLASGAAFATNSKLCANAAFVNDGIPTPYVQLVSVIAHGTLITNVRSNTYPYLSW